MKVAVIGAGAAGLCVARHLKSVESKISFDVFEKSQGVGGIWKYNKDTGLDKHGLEIHSAMYNDLKTNLPKQTMEFRGFEHKHSLPTYLHHTDVLDYLESYCKHFDLTQHIKFETIVKHIVPITTGDYEQWQIEYTILNEKRSITELYDAVFICNGHYSTPSSPIFIDEKSFQGSVIHSQNYRTNNEYKDKNVLVLGFRASGMDISINVAKVAKHVKVSRRGNKSSNSKLLPNMSLTKNIAKFHKDGKTVEFIDGDTFEVDAIIYCTGYNYDFPFLDEKCGIKVENKHIKWLYRQLFNVFHPSMFFIGICTITAPFPQFDCQAQCAISVILGKVKLLSVEQILTETKQDFEQKISQGMLEKEVHVLDALQWKYNDMICDLGKVERLPRALEELYLLAGKRRSSHLCSYKTETYGLVNGKYTII